VNYLIYSITLLGKKFRKYFRVPYSIYLSIVDWARNKNIRAVSTTDHFGRSSAPLEVLILAVLTILGHGISFEIVSWLASISEPIIRNFYHLFCEKYSKEFYEQECGIPEDTEDINSILESYSQLGLPGCIGSTDCVHLAWDRCPSAHRTIHKGKEGYPTLAYSVTCTHSRRIIGVTKGFPGTVSDKTICRYDSFLIALRTQSRYLQLSYQLYNTQDDTLETMRGAYVICDGGYYKWRTMQCPRKNISILDMIKFSKYLESVRKDIERTFGILKKRVYILRLPFKFHQ
jgi:hypothetical protein